MITNRKRFGCTMFWTSSWRRLFVFQFLVISVLIQAFLFIYFITTNNKGFYLSEEKNYVSQEQRLLNYVGDYLRVQVFIDDSHVDVVLTNTGFDSINYTNWTIYFNLMHKPRGNLVGYRLRTRSGLSITYQGGLYYRIDPNPEFYKSFEPFSNKTVSFETEAPMPCRDYVFPTWYVAYKHLNPRIIRNTDTDTSNFVEQLYSSPNVDENLARIRYENNNVYMPFFNDCDVIPFIRDASVNKKDPYVNIRKWVIVSVPKFKSEAEYLSDKIHLPVSTSFPSKHYIFITDDPPGKKMAAEEYMIESSNKQIIRIIANKPAGAFYGIQTLMSIIKKDENSNEYLIPSEIKIKDKPRFEFRGMMLDVARNFPNKDTVMKLIDIISMYKLNTLHLHLTDDEGWRLEIPGLEELTRLGANRCHERKNRNCLHPSFGSGPNASSSGSSFFTVQDYQTILKYAKRRHVTIIPEIDFPGHARAAIESMILRSRERNNDKFSLHEWGDRSQYSSLYGYPRGTVNICIDSTFNFLEKVISSLKKIHENIQPLKKVHVGGDEVGKSSWELSKSCLQLKEEHNITDVRLYFLNKLLYLLEKYDIDMHIWEDGVIPSKLGLVEPYQLTDLKSASKYSRNIYTNAWDNLVSSKKISRAFAFANAGYKVIMSGGTHLYLDHHHEDNFDENGLNWAAKYIDTKKIFFYLPLDLYGNTDKYIPQEEKYKISKPENIVGMQASLFSELIRNQERLFYMMFPRILAVAERAWYQAPWETMTDKFAKDMAQAKDWSRFSSILGTKELYRLDMLGIPYRVPPPGVILRGNLLIANVAFPGLHLEWSIDNGQSWKPFRKSKGPRGEIRLTVNVLDYGEIYVRTSSADMQRKSRIVKLQNAPPSNKNDKRKQFIKPDGVNVV